MSRSRTSKAQSIGLMVGVLCGLTSDNLLTARRFTMDDFLWYFTATDIPTPWTTSSMQDALTRNAIDHVTPNASHRSVQVPTEIANMTSVSFFSSCPVNTSLSHNQPTIPQLHFVHIRKTGGTAVEAALSQAGIDPCKLCFSVRLNRKALEAQRKSGNRQHIPPRYWRNWQFRKNRDNIHLFAIVRNPYDRAISEYYQYFKSGFHQPPLNISVNDPEFLNEFIQTRYRRSDGDLFIPQYEYIFDHQGNRIVDQILHFESLHDVFPKLMACYGLNITLPDEPVNQMQTGSKLKRNDLSPQSIALINEVEKISFELFGFAMLSVNSTSHVRNTTNSLAVK